MFLLSLKKNEDICLIPCFWPHSPGSCLPQRPLPPGCPSHMHISPEQFVQVGGSKWLGAVSSPPIQYITSRFCFLLEISILSFATQRLSSLAGKPVAAGEGIASLSNTHQHHTRDARQVIQVFFDVLPNLSLTKFFSKLRGVLLQYRYLWEGSLRWLNHSVAGVRLGFKGRQP